MKKYSNLLLQLREFGLNPNHWEISNRGSKLKVCHLENKDLNLIGEVGYKDKKPFWFHLELMPF